MFPLYMFPDVGEGVPVEVTNTTLIIPLSIMSENTGKHYTTRQKPDREILESVVQSIVRLMSSLVVKMLTVLVSTISNSQVFLLKKCE